jgi:hypothetical protein
MLSQRTQIRIQDGQEIAEDHPQSISAVRRQEASAIGSTQKVPHFVQRPSRYAHKALIVARRRPAKSFGDVGTDAAGSANQLMPHRGLRKRFKALHRLPNLVS